MHEDEKPLHYITNYIHGDNAPKTDVKVKHELQYLTH